MRGRTRSVQASAPIGVEDLLSEPAALALFQEAGLNVGSVRPQYFRPKPEGGAIVAYELEGKDAEGSPVPMVGYVRLASGPHERMRMAERLNPLRAVPTPLGPGIRHLRGGIGTLFLFPNDAGLRKLRFVATRDRLKRVMAELDPIRDRGYRVRGRRTEMLPVRYKPERRFVARARLALVRDADGERDTRDVFLRLFRDHRGLRIERMARLLRASTPGGLFPRPLGTALAGRLYVEEAVQGQDLLDAVLEGGAGPEELAQAMVGLHRSGCDLRVRFGVADVLTRLREGTAVLAIANSSLGESGLRLLERLTKIAPSDAPPVPIHGDLHLHQVLVTSGGPVIVDLERAGMGDPLLDVAELLAHLVELAEERPDARDRIEQFRLGLEEAVDSSAPRPPEELAFFVAAALANRALLRIRRLAPDRLKGASRLMDLASSMMDGPGARPRGRGARSFFARTEPLSGGFLWEVFYPQQTGPWPGFLERPARCAPSGPDQGVPREGAGSDRLYGLCDPEDGGFRPVAPEDDTTLPSLAEWAARGEIVSYRVGRRATLRLREPQGNDVAYVKVVPARKADRLLARTRMAEAACAASSDPLFPSSAGVLEARPEEGVLIFREVPGPSLHELIMCGDSAVPEALEHTAAAVRSLHAVEAEALGLERPRPAPAPDFYATLAARHFPERATAYRGVLRTILADGVERISDGSSVIHGDLHDKNVILGDESVTLLDLDLLRPGRPEEDVGNLAAHLILRGLQRGDALDASRSRADHFLSAYSDSERAIQLSLVRAVVATTLFRLSCLYLFRRRWQLITGDLLQEAVRWAHQRETARA